MTRALSLLGIAIGVPVSLGGCALISDAALGDRLDGDGDGVQRPDDCDDADALSGGEVNGFIDGDGDGFGGAVPQLACPGPGFSTVSTDCNDADAAIFPGATELCNDVDDDCDTVVDDGAEPATWGFDGDLDTYGTPFNTLVACDQPPGYVADGSDCDDTDPAVNPDTPWFLDADGDGFGDAGDALPSCEQPPGRVRDGTDCDDARADVLPGGVELCDDVDVDEDCNGAADNDDPAASGQSLWYADADGDGLGTVFTTTLACDAPAGFTADLTDCDDADPAVISACGWVQVSAAEFHTCGLQADGTITCFGYDGYGECEPPAERFIAVSTGYEQSCGVLPGGALACWGRGDWGVPDPPVGTFTQVGVADQFACALSTEGTIQCWGDVPPGLPVPSDAGYTAISMAGQAGCALDSAGNVQGWGFAEPATGPFTAVEGGQYDCMALTPEGEIVDLGDRDTPSFPAGVYSAVSLAPYGDGCALDASGHATCWGNVASSPDATFVSIAAGGTASHACGITADGELLCWGYDNHGQATPPG